MWLNKGTRSSVASELKNSDVLLGIIVQTVMICVKLSQGWNNCRIVGILFSTGVLIIP